MSSDAQIITSIGVFEVENKTEEEIYNLADRIKQAIENNLVFLVQAKDGIKFIPRQYEAGRDQELYITIK